MKNLRDLLPIGRSPLPMADIDEKTVFHICKKVIAEEYGIKGGENIIPTFYKDKKLFLSPRSSLWGNEVFIGRESLREKINTMIGRDVIDEIRISQQC